MRRALCCILSARVWMRPAQIRRAGQAASGLALVAFLAGSLCRPLELDLPSELSGCCSERAYLHTSLLSRGTR